MAQAKSTVRFKMIAQINEELLKMEELIAGGASLEQEKECSDKIEAMIAVIERFDALSKRVKDL